MHIVEFALLVLAGVGGGLSGSVAGLASLISYPALLAVGLTPVSANATNTVALVFNSLGSVSGSRPELRERMHHVRSLAALCLAGGLGGAVLLLVAPAHSFELVVPGLIALASLAILIRPRPRPEAGPRGQSPATLAAATAIAVYGGYFGAAAGVLMLALLLRVTGESLAHANAVKNLVMGLVNVTAAVLFIVTGHVQWAPALPLAIGLFVGGRLGPLVVRRVPATGLRIVIGLAGLALAVYLAL